MNESNRTDARILERRRALDEIAFQSNLLALNAAIEAGESSLGFAAAADEVRNLVHRGLQPSRDWASAPEKSL